MPATQQKDGTWRIKKKDGTLGTRKFTSKKNALAAQRSGGAKKGAKKPAKKGGGGGSNPATTSSSHRVGTGKGYQSVRATVLLLSPITERGIRVVQGKTTPSAALASLRQHGLARPHLTHLAVVTGDIMVDRSKKVGQAAAMSRGSVTAWLPEVYLGLKSGEDVFVESVNDPEILHSRIIQRTTGYAPAQNRWRGRDALTYRLIKHGGQAVRLVGNRVKIAGRAKRALQELILRPMGATL